MISETTLNKAEILDFFDKGKLRKALKVIEKYAKLEGPLEPIIALIQELIERNYATMMKNLWYNSIVLSLYKFYPTDQVVEMDRDKISKVALLPGEELITNFNGVLTQKKESVTGNIYLTNCRIIADGVYDDGSKSNSAGRHPGLIKALVVGVREARRALVKTSVLRAMSQAIPEAFDQKAFGHLYPIMNAYNIKRSKKAVEYSVTLNYKSSRGKDKQVSIDVKLQPSKIKKEPSDLFNKRKEAILGILEQLLVDFQNA